MPPARALLFLATFAAVGLAGRVALGRSVPLGAAVGAAIAYAAIVLAGVLFLRLRMFVDAITRGPAGARGVVLTFDDGPDPVHTAVALDALDRVGAKATFFVIGRKVDRYPDVVRAIVERGHAVGLHAHAHDRLMALRSAARVRADLRRGIQSVERATGVRPTLFRPPVGHTNPTIARVADELGLTVVGWTVSGLDGVASARADRVAARVRRGLGDGAIVALHDAPERGTHDPAGVRALPAILDAIAAERLEVVPLASWIEAVTPRAGG
jgi:peptidoglycan/xylan/chitin deacetylase (PgdA/CDA1 family)